LGGKQATATIKFGETLGSRGLRKKKGGRGRNFRGRGGKLTGLQKGSYLPHGRRGHESGKKARGGKVGKEFLKRRGIGAYPKTSQPKRKLR